MIKLKSLSKFFAITLIFAFTMSSCMTTRTSVGQYAQKTGHEYTYATGKQVWVLWGLVPVGRTNVRTPADGNCMVQTNLTFVDFVISAITGGLVTTYTIEVKAKN